MTSATAERARASVSRVRRVLASAWFAPIVVGAIAIAAGVALPLAPVQQSEVHVAWPEAGAATESTTLLLTNQTPHSIDVAFTGRAAGAAAESGGTVLATIRPDSPDAESTGLVISATPSTVTFATSGRSWSWPVAGSDEWRLHSTIHGLEIFRNGEVVQSDPGILPPQVDALLTDSAGLSADALSAHLQLVDDSNDRPTPVKVLLIAILVIALALVLIALRRDDRRRLAGSRPVEGATPAVGLAGRVRDRIVTIARSLTPADAVLVGTLTLWIFIGPMTDDDGYYSVMSYNAAEAGYVGNYYQMFNQTFTPFTWVWQAMDLWQTIGGRSPVWLRVPSLICAIVAWFVSRTILNHFLRHARWGAAEAARLLLAVVTVVWWGSYAIGVRPESFPAMATVIVIALLWRVHSTRRLTPAAVAVAVAALAFAVHPIGLVSAVPLVLAIPMMWRVAREGSRLSTAIARTVAVASASTIALLAAFGDGTVNDMLTGQQRFALVEQPLTWADEFRRYEFLLTDIPMGSFARRSVVLVGLVLLVWFIVFTVWSRRVAPFSPPRPFSLIGWSFGASFIVMWITTSKWTHHFGALASVGPLFIVLMCVVVPRLVSERLGVGGRLPWWLAPLAIASTIPAMILSLRGPDWWAYDWGQGAGIGNRGRPEVWGVTLANYVAWALLAAIIIVGTLLLAHRRRNSSRAPEALFGVVAIVGVFFGMTGTYLVGTFVWLASPSHQGFTVGKALLADPTGSECLTDDAIKLWDVVTGTPLPAVADSTRAVGFTSLSGREALPTGTSVEGWTTNSAPDGIGNLRTPWYAVPPLARSERVGVLVSGDFVTGTQGVLHAEFRSGAAVVDVDITDSGLRPGWTTLLVPVPAHLQEASDLEVRVLAEDVSSLPGANISVTAPAVVHETTLLERSTPNAPTAVAWTQSFWFPCDRPMTIARGLIEPPQFATTYGDAGIDAIWGTQRGGSLAGVQRLASVNTPATGLGDTLAGTWGRVHFFAYPTKPDAYDLTQTWVTTPGWRSAFDPASQLVSGRS